MKQTIDFLKTPPQTAYQLPAKWITLASIASIVILMLISLNMALNQVRDNLEITNVHEESLKVTAQFQTLAKKHPLLAGETPLAVQIGALEKEIEERKREYAVISRANLRYGFSNYLATLARIAPQGLWLNQISINQERKNAALSGYLIEPIDVSVLLQALQNSPIFAQTVFNVFYLQDMPGKPYTSFSITNKAFK